MSKKILYLITKSDVGGAQKYVSDLATNLDKNKFEAKILYGGRDVHWLSNKIWPFFINDWLAIWELMKLYKKEQPDIIHLNSSKAGFLGSLAAFLFNKTNLSNKSNRTTKIIFTAHGWVFNPTNAISLPIRWFYIFLHKIAALFQDKIICVSEYDYNLALHYRVTPKEKLAIIHNGIDSNIKFLDKETARKELTKGIGYRVQGLENTNKSLTPSPSTLNPNWPWIGSVGRLVKEKNYETLIAAAKSVPNAYFFIIGAGPKLHDLRQTTDNLRLKDRFFFIEPTGDDAKFLKAFDIFVMSSIKEGLPYILLEAMAAELPIVVTKAGGMPEVIKNHENGLMVAQKNPEFIAKAIHGLLTNPNIAKELGGMAKQAALNKFNLEKMVSETSQIYSDVLVNLKR